MKITLKQVDSLYAGITELLQQGLNTKLIYKLVSNKKALHDHVESIRETLTKISQDNEGKEQNEVIRLQNEAIEELFKNEVDVDLKQIEWSELPQEIKGTIIENIEIIMTGEL